MFGLSGSEQRLERQRFDSLYELQLQNGKAWWYRWGPLDGQKDEVGDNLYTASESGRLHWAEVI